MSIRTQKKGRVRVRIRTATFIRKKYKWNADWRASDTPLAAAAQQRSPFSYHPELYFSRGWHPSNYRFARKDEADAFVAHLRAAWNPPDFIKRARIKTLKKPPNVSLDWETKRANPLAEPYETREADTLSNDGRAA